MSKQRGLGMPYQGNHWFAERLAYLGWSLSTDAVWRIKVWNIFPRYKLHSKAEGHRKGEGKAPFTRECCKALRNIPGSSDLSRSRKELYRELVVGSTSDLVVDRLGWLMEEVPSHWNWVPGSDFLNNSEFSFTWQLTPFQPELHIVSGRHVHCGSGWEETVQQAS